MSMSMRKSSILEILKVLKIYQINLQLSQIIIPTTMIFLVDKCKIDLKIFKILTIKHLLKNTIERSQLQKELKRKKISNSSKKLTMRISWLI